MLITLVLWSALFWTCLHFAAHLIARWRGSGTPLPVTNLSRTSSRNAPWLEHSVSDHGTVVTLKDVRLIVTTTRFNDSHDGLSLYLRRGRARAVFRIFYNSGAALGAGLTLISPLLLGALVFHLAQSSPQQHAAFSPTPTTALVKRHESLTELSNTPAKPSQLQLLVRCPSVRVLCSYFLTIVSDTGTYCAVVPSTYNHDISIYVLDNT